MIESVNLGQLFTSVWASSGGSSVPFQAAPQTDAQELRSIRRTVSSLRRLLDTYRGSLQIRRPRYTAAVARSSTDLGLQPVALPATLRSTEEVNTTPTSFSPFGPAFAGASTSEATVTGVYDGSDGNDTLTFKVKKAGIVGSNSKPMIIDVLDGGGRKIDSISIAKDTPADTAYTLKNDLVVSFSAGELVKNDTFTVDVHADTGSVVDPDKSFDGARTAYANFEYGTTIIAGSFEVNGETIAVGASDSLRDVLDRITASAAGVTAEFDAGTETVLLTQKTPGAQETIVLANDSSGFLAATKLSDAITVPGIDGDAEDVVIALVPELAGISSGTATVNGVAIAVDIDNDTLNQVLARINASAAGATATLSQDAQRVSVASNDPSAPLVLDDGNTGLFATLAIDEGTYARRRVSTGISTDRAGLALRRVAQAFNDLFRYDAPGVTAVETLRSGLRQALEKRFDQTGPRLRNDLGLRFDFGENARRVFEFGSSEQAAFRRALATRPEEVRVFFLESGESGSDTLIGSMIESLAEAERQLLGDGGSTGQLLDATA